MRRVLIVLAVVIAAVLSGGCSIQPKRGAPTPTPVPLPQEPDKPVFKVRRGTLVDSIQVLGRVVPAREVELYFTKAGQVVVVNTEVDKMVKKGQVLAEVETGAIREQLAQAQFAMQAQQLRVDKAQTAAKQARQQKEIDLAKAKTTLELAQLKLKEKEAQLPADSSSNLMQLERAKLTLESARLRLVQAQESSRLAASRYQDDLAIAKANLDRAQVELQTAQAAYDSVAWRPDVAGTSQAKNLHTATLNYNATLNIYERLKKGPAPDYSLELAQIAYRQAEMDYQLVASKAQVPDYELESLRKGVVLAQLEVDKFQQALAENIDYDLETLKVDLAKAKSQVDQFQAQIVASQIIAPFDGRIRRLSVSIGKQVRGYESVITLGEVGDIDIVAEVQKADLNYVSVGTPVTFTQSTVMGETYIGKLSRLPGTTMEQGIERSDPYTHFKVDDPGRKLQVGDSVMVNVSLRQRENILIVPAESIRVIRGKQYVELWQGGKVKLVEVKLGMMTAEFAEIASGVDEGQEVLGR